MIHFSYSHEYLWIRSHPSEAGSRLMEMYEDTILCGIISHGELDILSSILKISTIYSSDIESLLMIRVKKERYHTLSLGLSRSSRSYEQAEISIKMTMMHHYLLNLKERYSTSVMLYYEETREDLYRYSTHFSKQPIFMHFLRASSDSYVRVSM